MRNRTLPIALLAAFVLSACGTLYSGIISITALVDGAAKQYATAYNSGLVPPDIAAKVAAAHLNYRVAALTAKHALEAYKAGGTESYDQAFALAQQSATEFINLVIPFFAPQDAIALQSSLKKATVL